MLCSVLPQTDERLLEQPKAPTAPAMGALMMLPVAQPFRLPQAQSMRASRDSAQVWASQKGWVTLFVWTGSSRAHRTMGPVPRFDLPALADAFARTRLVMLPTLWPCLHVDALARSICPAKPQMRVPKTMAR